METTVAILISIIYFNVFLMFFGGGIDLSLYPIKKSLSLMGWIVVITTALLVIFVFANIVKALLNKFKGK
jgi:phosphotransferase system  glucose/maltose/N-acetylglucosamine-specific IIC component